MVSPLLCFMGYIDELIDLEKQSQEEARKMILEVADRGDADAQLEAGMLYMQGDGVEQDYKKGYEWFEKSAKRGNPLAMVNLGLCYQLGNGTEQDLEESRKWYRASCEAGCSVGFVRLGLLHQNEGKSKAAVICYHRAAFLGDPDGMLLYGYSLLHGIGVEKNVSLARENLEKSASDGRTQAMYVLSQAWRSGIFGNTDRIKESEYLLEAAKKGHVNAMNDIGVNYEYGYGIRENHEQAAYWYRKAIEYGQTDAMNNLGAMMVKNISEGTPEEAVSLFRQAAEKGLGVAMFNLSLCYTEGNGVKEDLAESAFWLGKSAEAGYGPALRKAGLNFIQAKHSIEELKKGFRYLKQAADQGDCEAMNDLGILLMEGTGCTPDERMAMIWFRKAADHGCKSATRNLEKLENATTGSKKGGLLRNRR